MSICQGRFNFSSIRDNTAILSSSINWYKLIKSHISFAILLCFGDINAGVKIDWQDWVDTSGDGKGKWSFDSWSRMLKQEWFLWKQILLLVMGVQSFTIDTIVGSWNK